MGMDFLEEKKSSGLAKSPPLQTSPPLSRKSSISKESTIDEPQEDGSPTLKFIDVSYNAKSSVVPNPPLIPKKRQEDLHSALWSHRACSNKAGFCVPKDTVETWDRLFLEGLGADVSVRTEDGGVISAHYFVLSASSTVLGNLLEEGKSKKHQRYMISILGVPHGAVKAFIRFLYSSRFENDDMKKYAFHLLTLSHVYCIPYLKRICSDDLEHKILTTENVIDVLQLARLCDASRLNVICLRLIIREFKAVAKSEAWSAMRQTNEALEEELVGLVIEADTRKQEKLRKAEEDKVYKQLFDAMEALVHMCRDGCRTIGPIDKALEGQKQAPCGFPACKGLESLVRHFAGCKVKVSGGCVHCKRMWQLLELHSRMCHENDSCSVPLCKHFKDRVGQQTRKEAARWKLLVSKVSAAKGTSKTFSLAAVSAKLEQEI